jgi:hypothetical protein
LNLFNGVFLWANTVLLLSCILKFLPSYTGSIPLFVLGAPFIVIVILGLPDGQKRQLMKALQKIESAEGFRRYINYYMIIVEKKGKYEEVKVMFRGG